MKRDGWRRWKQAAEEKSLNFQRLRPNIMELVTETHRPRKRQLQQRSARGLNANLSTCIPVCLRHHDLVGFYFKRPIVISVTDLI